MKKQKAQFTTTISAQIPAGVTVWMEDVEDVNPKRHIFIEAVSLSNANQADNLIKLLLDTLDVQLG